MGTITFLKDAEISSLSHFIYYLTLKIISIELSPVQNMRNGGQNSARGIATCYGHDGPTLESRCELSFLCMYLATLRPTSFPAQGV